MIHPTSPALVLAPMEGVTDAPMRALQGEAGAFTFAVSEFLRIAQGIPGPAVFHRHIPELLTAGRTPTGLPVQVQLLGGDAEKLASAAVVACGAGAWGIDLNFGCPAPTVNRHDGGATLLKYPKRIRAIVAAVRAAVPPAIPVSAKLRLGWESVEDVHENAAMAAEGGADWLTIHARTRTQGYAPPVYWPLVGRVRERLGIPVVANGDIRSLEDFRRCREETGCLHFMLGRGALARPGLARRVAADLGLTPPAANEVIDWEAQLKRLIAWTPGYAQQRPDRAVHRFKQWLKMAATCGDFRDFDRVKRARDPQELFALLRPFPGDNPARPATIAVPAAPFPEPPPMTADTDTSRRGFLTTSALATSALAVSQAGLFAGQNSALKIGLVGCGGRGTGAAVNALRADSNVKLVALGDVFEDNLQASLKNLQRSRDVADKVAVKPDMLFTGFDAYKKVIEASDVVLLCTPPHFRPMHLKAAVEAGKHVFAEKPVAVDAPGVRSVLESAAKAKEKKLGLLVGYCYRWDLAKRETVKRIHAGDIGDVTVIHVNYITGELWHKAVDKPFDTMEYQMRNWYYFNWLSGDHIVEQHCHNHDKAAWVLNGEYPVSAYGTGGRQKRTDPKWGNIYDHHSVVYEYRSGAKVFSFCRQMSGATRLMTDVSDHVIGTKGSAQLMKHTVTAGGKTWGYEGPEPSMYDQEHLEFYAGLRAGEPINNGVDGANSTLMSIMGRMATYTGMKITADMALKSQEDLSPPSYEWGPLKYAPVPVPGVTKFL